MESECKNSLFTKSWAKFIKATALGWNWPTDSLFLPLFAPSMKKMLIFCNTNTNISSSTDANSSFGNTVTTTCANTAREEEDEEEEEAGWLHFCNGEVSWTLQEETPTCPSRSRWHYQPHSQTQQKFPPRSTLRDKEALGVRAAALRVTSLHQATAPLSRAPRSS